MSDKISVGDWVKVLFTTAQMIGRAKVLSVPCATGDSWILKEADGTLHYVQLFNRMTRI